MPNTLKLLPIFLCFPFLVWSQKHTINGFIQDNQSGENLIGATVYDVKSGKGVIANAYGFYSLTLPIDSVHLRVSFVGYETQSFKLLLNEDVTLDVSLNNGSYLDEIVINAEESIENLTQMSSISVPIEQLKKVPMLMGEVDVMKTLQLLPGIQGGNEGTSGIYVRGGGPDQNLILIDGVPVYNSSHLFGFFSIFNADAINNVTVVKGGFPARYTGRLSSVIDISMKEGNNQEIKGKASIGLISSKLTLEGPILNEKTSFIISARRTYIDILARPIIQAQTDGDSYGGYFFHDLNFKVNHRFSEKDRLYLSFYGGKDKFYFRDKYEASYSGITETYEDEGGIEWGNLVGALRWNHVFSPKLFGNLTATYSRYKFDVFNTYEIDYSNNQPDESDNIRYKSGIWDYTLKFDLDYLPHPDHTIKTGAMFINHTFQPGVFAYSYTGFNEDDGEPTSGTLGASEIGANELAVFVEDDFSVGSKLKINAGISSSLFQVRSENFTSFQPRISARFLASKSLSIKASYAQMTQFIHLLTNGGLGLPTDLWVPATDQIGPQDSWQIALGAAKTVGEFEVSLESYYKEMDGLIEYKDGSSFFNTSEDWESKVAIGQGTSYGLELLVQRKVGRLSGWVGYTWSKTTRQFDELNFGKEFSYKFDRRHDVSLVGVFEINDRVTLSGTWVYGTGNAISLPDSQFPLFGNGSTFSQSVEYYPERNNYRMRAYHRMDLGITHRKEKKRGVRSWSYGAYNVYSRQNPFFLAVQEKSNGDGQELVQYSLFPIIPYITYSFEF